MIFSTKNILKTRKYLIYNKKLKWLIYEQINKYLILFIFAKTLTFHRSLI